MNICGNCENWRCDDILHNMGHCRLSRIDKFNGADADNCSNYKRRLPVYTFPTCTSYCDEEPEMADEEAIKWLAAIKDKYIRGGDEEFDQNRRTAIDIAIKALEERANR